jgi:hypothetical protein
MNSQQGDISCRIIPLCRLRWQTALKLRFRPSRIIWGARRALTISVLQIDLESLSEAVAEIEAEASDASAIVGNFDSAVDYAEGALHSLRLMRDGYVDQLGIPAAMNEAAIAIVTTQSKPAIAGLRYGLELMAGSPRKLSSELLQNMLSLGMPRAAHGRVIKTYAAAARSGYHRWLADAEKGAV